MDRPTGVTIIAILYWLGTFFSACLGVLALAGAGIVAALLKRNNVEFLAGIGVILARVLFFSSLVFALLGWAIWSLKNWARIVTIVICGLRVFSAAMVLLWGLAHVNPFVLVSLVGIALNGLIVWYLLQPHVKQVFGATSF